MPILVAPQAPPVTPIPPSMATDLFWTSAAMPGFPDGRRTQLTNWQSFDSGVMTRPGVLGLLMPPWDFFADKSPAIDGETIRGVRAGAREITIPLYVWGRDRDQCLVIFRNLIADLNPQLGEGILEVREPAGQRRTIGAYYAAGFEGVDDDDAQGRTWMSALVTFRAPRPFWEGEEWSKTWRIGGAPGSFFPFLPFRVRDSQVIGALTVPNVGNVRTFPVWTVTGPFTSFEAVNDRTGKTFTLDASVAEGETVVVDAREGRKTVLLDGVTNMWEFVTTGSSLWALEPGDNDVTFDTPGSDDATSVTLSYKPRFLAAY